MKRFPDESPADYKLRRLKDKVDTQSKLKGKLTHLSILIFKDPKTGCWMKRVAPPLKRTIPKGDK